MSLPRSLTVSQVADKLRISRTAAYEVSHELGFLVGRAIRVDEDVLDRWISRRKAERPGHTIYFVQAESAGLIKIGVTRNLDKRLRGLKAMSPVGLALLASRPGWYDEESQLHLQFNHLRAHGEWFRPGEDLLEFIRAHGEPTQ